MSLNIYNASTKELEQVAGNVDPADIKKLENDVVQLSDEKANNGSSAYNPSASYTVGRHCIHNGKLWMCLVACSGVEPTEGTYWTEVTMSSINDNIMPKKITNIASSVNSKITINSHSCYRIGKLAILNLEFAITGNVALNEKLLTLSSELLPQYLISRFPVQYGGGDTFTNIRIGDDGGLTVPYITTKDNYRINGLCYVCKN